MDAERGFDGSLLDERISAARERRRARVGHVWHEQYLAEPTAAQALDVLIEIQAHSRHKTAIEAQCAYLAYDLFSANIRVIGEEWV